MEASAPRSDTFSRDYKPRSSVPSFERLDADADATLGESFSSSTASFIDMDPEELFSMRWTSSEEEEDGFRFGLPRAAGACSSPLLAASAGLAFSDDSLLLLPCDEGAAHDVGGGDASACSSPAFHTAQSTPVAASVACSARRPAGGAAKPLLATRRILLRYLRFLVPLCRKARALRRLPVPVPGRVFFSAPRPRALATATPARRSTSSASSSSAAAEYWCHGNADVAVRDAILHCKKSLLTARTEC